MTPLSNKEILENILGIGYSTSQVFLAEKIIENHIGLIPEKWDDTLSMITAEIVKRLLILDNGVKSENVEGHSITYRDTKNLRELLGPGLVAILDWYAIVPISDGMNGSFWLI